jgi:para-nitrobenzyl esterase
VELGAGGNSTEATDSMKIIRHGWTFLFALLTGASMLHAQEVKSVQQRTANGVLEGVVSADGKVRAFKGIPFAAPPVGPLRWKPPQPPAPWTGVRKAVEFGPHCMQGRIYDDMIFRDAGPSEDCLYLNLWLPANPPPGKLPVMVWIHGGGFAAGASSEPRQDGGNLSKLGVLVVSLNYRLGILGFFVHPELTKESGHNASGNYGLLDQVAALEWVKKNIATFGGDPDNVTIFGESAGSMSVSALVASPLAKGLFHRAIGESGACWGNHVSKSREEAESAGVKFAESAFGTSSLEALRAKSAQEILDASLKPHTERSWPDVDGYFMPEDCNSIYAAGKQSRVPLLAGWNKDEGSYKAFFDKEPPTLDNYVARAKVLFGNNADAFLKVYSAKTDAEAKRAAQDYEGDQFIAFSTWKWLDMQLKTGKSKVFRYEFDQTLPLAAGVAPGTEPTAPHASDIEFVFRVLSSRDLPWRPEDQQVSELMAAYWTNFAKTGDPNGANLPHWPAYDSQNHYQVMHLTPKPAPAPDSHRDRYEFLERLGPLK